MKRMVMSIAAGLLLATPGSTQPASSRVAAAHAQPIFAITYRAGPGWKAGIPMERQGLRDHYYYWKALDAAGRVAAAGPLGPDGGLILLYASDQSAAEQVIADDPASKSGIFVGEARRFVPRFVGKTALLPVNP